MSIVYIVILSLVITTDFIEMSSVKTTGEHSSAGDHSLELSSLRIMGEHSVVRQVYQSHEPSSPRKVENPVDGKADDPPVIQAGQSFGTQPNLLMVTRFTTYNFPKNIGLQTKGTNRNFQKMLVGKTPVLAVGDYAVARIQGNNGVIRGVFNENRKRVKVNMKTKRVELMTPDEQNAYPTGKELHIPGTLLIRGNPNEPHDWDPNIFLKEVEKSPNIIHNASHNSSHSNDWDLNISQTPPHSPAQSQDLHSNVVHSPPHNHGHTRDWDLNVVPKSPHQPASLHQ